MPTSVDALVKRTRRFVRDWPNFDALSAPVASNATTLTVADANVYATNWHIQVGIEAMRVRNASGTTVTVARGAMGTTPAAYGALAEVLIQPKFLDVEILDALNAGLQATFPLMYKPVAQEYIGVQTELYEYELPLMDDRPYPIPYLYKVEYQEYVGDAFRLEKAWRIIRSGQPTLKFRRPIPAGGTLRIHGFGPFKDLAFGGNLDDYWPSHADDLLVWFAGNYLLASGEAGRTAIDTGAAPIDQRESANRVGSAMAASNSLFQRFQLRLRESSMPPLPKHIVQTF